MNEILIQAGVIVPVVVALAEVAKNMKFPKKYLPLFDMAAGTLISVFYVGADIKTQIAVGVIAGLTACGAYSASKNTIQAVKKVN